jgi:uncharacterized protein (DUF2062 family)
MSIDVQRRARVRRGPLARTYYRLRTRRDSPRQQAGAVWLGVTIGCTPLFGLHLLMCIVFARLLGLSAVTTYLASYVNNPFVMPLTLYLSVGIGRWLFTGEWPVMRLDYAHAVGVWHLGRDILVGSLVVGLTLGGLLAALVYRFSSQHQARHALERRLIDTIARRYRNADLFDWEFVQAKLKRDPLYFGLLKADLLPRAGRVLDLGCGRGILLALLTSAARLYASGQWRSDWPAPPTALTLAGVDASPANIAVARAALGNGVELRVADLRDYEPPAANVVLLLDVLHYLPAHRQPKMLARASAALEPGGMLLIRDADADAGLRFTLTRLAELAAAWCRGEWRPGFHYRGRAAWVGLLRAQGLIVETRDLSAGTPFANVLIVARKH